eukprot:gene9324-12562_t
MALNAYHGAIGGGSLSTNMALPFNMNNSHNKSSSNTASDSVSNFISNKLDNADINSITRGEFTGDECFTADFYSSTNQVQHGSITTAVWSEKENISSFKRHDVVAVITADDIPTLDDLKACKTKLNNAQHDISESKTDIKIGMKEQVLSSFKGPYIQFPFIYLYLLNHLSVLDPDRNYLIELLSLLIGNITSNSVQLSNDINQSSTSTKTKKKKAPKKQSLTLVTPCGFDQAQLSTLSDAILSSDVIVKNYFNRAVSTLAGRLFREQIKQNVKASKQTSSNLSSLMDQLETEPVVLYINIIHINDISSPPFINNSHIWGLFDCALVRCEGHKEAKSLGNLLGYERFSTLASKYGIMTMPVGQTKEVIMSTPDVIGLLKTITSDLFQLASLQQDAKNIEISAVIVDGWLIGNKSLLTSLSSIVSTSKGIFEPKPEDAAVGASLLSAAELDSSKQYLQLETGEWKIAYQLPIADNIINNDFAIQVIANEKEKVEIMSKPLDSFPSFASGSRVWKSQAGPFNVNHTMNPSSLVHKSEFKYGSLYNPFRSNAPSTTYPMIRIMQKSSIHEWKTESTSIISDENHMISKNNLWNEVKVVYPMSNYAKPTPLVVESCQCVIQADPHTGQILVTETKGISTNEKRQIHLRYLQLILLLLLPFFAIAGYYLLGYCMEQYETYQHMNWLKDFYAKNAPEKLSDPTYVARTIKKYKGKMFLLWRALEKTYKVKWTPPASIVDGNGNTIEL